MFGDMQLSKGNGPIYRRIADALASAIADGRFAPGERLPPQRQIAQEAGVNLTTITRAFADLQERGLVDSKPGRGSIVADRRGRPSRFKSSTSDEQGFVDLSVNRPATMGYLEALARVLPKMPNDPRYEALQDFHAPEGPLWAREVVGGWFAALAGLADMRNVVVTNGAQHALACALGAITRPGDAMLCDAVTYQGISALCRSLGLQPVPIAMDDEGMRPDALAQACRSIRPRAVFLVPTLHNPTTVTLSAERRREIETVARAGGMLIIEDDVYRALKPDAPESFASFAPDITIHIGSLSKCVAPGLRLGVVFAPPQVAADIAAMLRIDCWSTSPLAALVAARLIEDGHADRIIAGQRAEFAVRQRLVRDVLAGLDVATDEDSTHAWLRLPEPWRVGAFVRACAQQGVGVLSGEAFAVSRDIAPHAVRINVGAARSREEHTGALRTIGEILSGNSKLLDVAM